MRLYTWGKPSHLPNKRNIFIGKQQPEKIAIGEITSRPQHLKLSNFDIPIWYNPQVINPKINTKMGLL
jgi:hypothetical protein